MNPLGFLAQLFFEYQTQSQTERLREAGLRAAEKGRRMAITGVCFAIAGLFFFSGLMIAIIDLGLQIDRGAGLSFSGLMVSAFITILAGLLCVFSGWLSGREPREIAPPPPPPPRPANELKDLLEELAVLFLRDFTQSQREARARAHAEKAETAP